MSMVREACVLVAGLLLVACSERPSAVGAKLPPAPELSTSSATATVDTAVSFRIGSHWVTPDSSFEFNALLPTGADTLHVVACQKYLIDPFGPVANMKQLQSSRLKNFAVAIRFTKQSNGIFPIQSLKKGGNRLLLYFQADPEEMVYSNILQGEINDSSVAFVNGVRVGMSVDSFYSRFFTVFPAVLQVKYKTVVFDYCVDDIRHIYDIKGGRISAVKFSQPSSAWKLTY